MDQTQGRRLKPRLEYSKDGKKEMMQRDYELKKGRQNSVANGGERNRNGILSSCIDRWSAVSKLL